MPPDTRAGRALLDWFGGPMRDESSLTKHIAAIEAEAREGAGLADLAHEIAKDWNGRVVTADAIHGAIAATTPLIDPRLSEIDWEQVAARLAIGAVSGGEGADGWEKFRQRNGWPTPNHMRRTAGALDSLTPAKYGDILRWVADACDRALATPENEQGGRADGEPGAKPVTDPRAHAAWVRSTQRADVRRAR